MKTLLDILPGEPDQAEGLRRVGSAYRAVFSANGTQDDVDLVLIDLAQFTRYYDTAKVDASPDAVVAAAHRKAVLDHILDAIEMSGGSVQGLRAATAVAPQLENEEN